MFSRPISENYVRARSGASSQTSSQRSSTALGASIHGEAGHRSDFVSTQRPSNSKNLPCSDEAANGPPTKSPHSQGDPYGNQLLGSASTSSSYTSARDVDSRCSIDNQRMNVSGGVQRDETSGSSYSQPPTRRDNKERTLPSFDNERYHHSTHATAPQPQSLDSFQKKDGRQSDVHRSQNMWVVFLY